MTTRLPRVAQPADATAEAEVDAAVDEALVAGAELRRACLHLALPSAAAASLLLLLLLLALRSLRLDVAVGPVKKQLALVRPRATSYAAMHHPSVPVVATALGPASALFPAAALPRLPDLLVGGSSTWTCGQGSMDVSVESRMQRHDDITHVRADKIPWEGRWVTT